MNLFRVRNTDPDREIPDLEVCGRENAHDPGPGRERGATIVEYAMLVSLIIGVTLVAIQGLTDTSGDYLSSTGNDIGEPRERIANMDPDLPDPPAWLP